MHNGREQQMPRMQVVHCCEINVDLTTNVKLSSVPSTNNRNHTCSSCAIVNTLKAKGVGVFPFTGISTSHPVTWWFIVSGDVFVSVDTDSTSVVRSQNVEKSYNIADFPPLNPEIELCEVVANRRLKLFKPYCVSDDCNRHTRAFELPVWSSLYFNGSVSLYPCRHYV